MRASASPATSSATPARAARSSSSAATSWSTGQHRRRPQRDDAGARLELAEEEHLVDQLADLLDLAPSLVDEVGDVLAGEQRELEQGEQTGERRPELVRDRGREARAQLLVGGHVADPGEVDEPLVATGDE